MTTEINEQPSETRIERAERAIKEAEQAYEQATDAPHKLRRKFRAELETINETLEQLGLETPVDEVVRLLNRRDALNFLIQASEKNVRPSRARIDEATRQGFAHLFSKDCIISALLFISLEYLCKAVAFMFPQGKARTFPIVKKTVGPKSIILANKSSFSP